MKNSKKTNHQANETKPSSDKVAEAYTECYVTSFRYRFTECTDWPLISSTMNETKG